VVRYATDLARGSAFHGFFEGGHRLSAFIPLLEVLPDYRGRGIGSELMRRMLVELEDIRAVDLCCDAELEGYSRRFGMEPVVGMAILRMPRSS
jgi:ribosomal protein S18 acetylase RimI-like enzyme